MNHARDGVTKLSVIGDAPVTAPQYHSPMAADTDISSASLGTPPDFASTDRTPEHRMLFFRGQPVLLDHDLATLYEVSTKALNQAVRRNMSRFPDDFLFVLTAEEIRALARLRPAGGTETPRGRGHHRKYPPLAFTEYGVAMLSSVLRSDRAVQVNIEIMRAFGRLRGLVAAHGDLARRLDELEAKTVEHDTQFRAVFEEIRRLLLPSPTSVPADPPRRPIGFLIPDTGTSGSSF